MLSFLRHLWYNVDVAKKAYFVRTVLTTLFLGAATAFGGEKIKVAVRADAPEFSDATGKIAAYSLAVLRVIADRCGWELEPQTWSKDSYTNCQVLASTYRLPAISAGFDCVNQAIGTVSAGLYSRAKQAKALRELPPYRWPRMRVATAPDILDPGQDFRAWAERNMVQMPEVEFPSVDAAAKAVREGRCDLLLAASFVSSEHFTRAAEFGDHPYCFAVKRGHKNIYRKISEGLERLETDNLPLLDSLREKFLGMKAPTNRVRVARYVEPCYSDMLLDGSYDGVNIDYINCVCEANGWHPTWVNCSYADSLDYLAKGKLDMVPCVTYTPERAKLFDFPHMSTGIFRTYLFARATSPFEAGNFAEWQDVRLATGPGSQMLAVVRQYLESHGVSYTLYEYEDTGEAIRAFYRGQCNMLHSVPSPQLAPEKVLETFPAFPAYICVPKGRDDLRSGVEKALATMRGDNPGFDDMVTSRHFVFKPKMPVSFTEAEGKWLRLAICNGDAIRVDISPEAPPVKTWDPENAKPTGFTKALFELLAARTGLTFVFVPPADAKTARRRFLDGEIDIWVDFGADVSGMPEVHHPSDGIKFPHMLICRRDTHLSDPSRGRIAVPEWDTIRFRSYHHVIGNGVCFLPFDSLAECFRAVVDGRADCTHASIYTAPYMIRNLGFSDVLETRIPGANHHPFPFTLSFAPSARVEMAGVIRKTVDSLDRLAIDACMAQSMMLADEKPLALALPILALVAGGIFALLALWMYLRKRAEARLAFDRGRQIESMLKKLESTADVSESEMDLFRIAGGTEK